MWELIAGESILNDISPAKNGAAIGLLLPHQNDNDNDMMLLQVPKVTNVIATFDHATVLRLSWMFNRANYGMITVINFNIRLWLADQTDEINVLFKGDTQYEQIIELKKLFPLIFYGDDDNYGDNELTVEICVRLMDLGLGVPETIDVQLGFESFEVIIASAIAIVVVCAIITGKYITLNNKPISQFN